MQRAPMISRAQAVAIPRPQLAPSNEWVAAGIALLLLLLALVGP